MPIMLDYLKLKSRLMTILYADDDADDCELVVEAFGKIDPNIQCTMANDGSHALKILEESGALPDYIFLDVNMPVMDGKDCLSKLKNDDRLKHIPVVIYSTTRDKEEIRALYELGADTFIQKPNSFAQLCVTLREVIDKLQSTAA
jgi:CheY-like chemotaxis protein